MNTPQPNDQLQAGQLELLHKQLTADIELLHEKEASLKTYETRLRALVDQGAGAAVVLHGVHRDGSGAELAAGWEKFHRSQALLEAERRAFKDERILLREELASLKKREDELDRREAWTGVREKELTSLVEAAQSVPAKRSVTTVPFLAVKQIFTRGARAD